MNDLHDLHRDQDFIEGKLRPSGETKFAKYTLPGGENYRELILTSPQSQQEDKTHYGGIKGYIAHVRINDRIDSENKKTLFIEEIQATEHQKGRKEGYKDPKKQAEYDARMKELTRLENENRKERRIYLDMIGMSDKQSERSKELKREEGRIADEIYRLNQENPHTAVPSAPFKKSWHELALKRMLRYAAEKGYDKIAWTTGEQQADRYDLSKQVDDIHYNEEDGLYNISAVKNNTEVLSKENQTIEQVAGILGKDIAEKIKKGDGVETESDDPELTFGSYKSLTGLDLKVGGEGMKAFYDRMIPQALQKMVKKYGAKVQPSKISKADDIEFAKGSGYPTIQPSVEITPSLKDYAMQGQPLFQKAERNMDENPELAVDQLRNILKENEVPAHIVDSIETPDGRKAYGVYDLVDQAIKFSKTVGKTTGYHEGFHAYINMFLSPQAQTEMFAEARRINPELRSNIEAEEWLADQFSDYAMNYFGKNESGAAKNWTGRLVQFFNRLMRKVQVALGLETKFNNLFTDIVEGKRPAKAPSVAEGVKYQQAPREPKTLTGYILKEM
jgi:hypothetical protein